MELDRSPNRPGRYLQHFGKIGPGDIVQLEVEIEKEKREKEREAEAEAAAVMRVDSAAKNGIGNGNEEQTVQDMNSLEVNGVARSEIVQGDGDVKMEAQ